MNLSFLAGHSGLGEGRHAVVAGDGGPDDSNRHRGSRTFAEPHAEIEQRRLAEALERLAMRPLGRDMAGEAMVERAFVERVKDRRRGALLQMGE